MVSTGFGGYRRSMVESGGKYDVSGNVESQYMDAASEVLRNRMGITDLRSLQIREEEALAAAYETLLRDVRADTLITCQFIREAHSRIFGELFEWAGRWRTVQISKPGAIWPAAQFLDQSMNDFERFILSPHPASGLANDEDFVAAIAAIQGEFLAIHPFREGNARTIKLVTDVLAAQSGRPLLRYDQSTEGADRYVLAAKAALLKRDYRPMTDIIREALAAARNG
jgi:cell filamentation protein